MINLNQTIGDRISLIISHYNIKKVAFAKKLNIDQSYVTQLIKGRSNPSDRLIEDICEKFNINESWFRVGQGDMFLELDRDEEIVQWASKLTRPDCTNEFAKRFVSMLTKLNEDEWSVLEKMTSLMFDEKKQKQD